MCLSLFLHSGPSSYLPPRPSLWARPLLSPKSNLPPNPTVSPLSLSVTPHSRLYSLSHVRCPSNCATGVPRRTQARSTRRAALVTPSEDAVASARATATASNSRSSYSSSSSSGVRNKKRRLVAGDSHAEALAAASAVKETASGKVDGGELGHAGNVSCDMRCDVRCEECCFRLPAYTDGEDRGVGLGRRRSWVRVDAGR